MQSAIVEPKPGSVLEGPLDEVEVRGFAYSGGGRGIIRVDVSPDGGKTWTTASLHPIDTNLYRHDPTLLVIPLNWQPSNLCNFRRFLKRVKMLDHGDSWSPLKSCTHSSSVGPQQLVTRVGHPSDGKMLVPSRTRLTLQYQKLGQHPFLPSFLLFGAIWFIVSRACFRVVR